MITETAILLDHKTRAVHSGGRWAVQKMQSDGNWDAVAFVTGAGRAMKKWCEENHVTPSREAEALLAAVPEAGFRDR